MITNLDDVWADKPEQADSLTLIKNRRKYRIQMVVAVGISYAIDNFMLFLFSLAGTIPSSVPLYYALAGASHVILFSVLHASGLSERSSNPQLNSWQTAYAIAVHLLFIAFVPQLTTFFLALMFIIFGFATLRLPLRQALAIWAVTCLAIGAVLIANQRYTIVIPHPNRFEAAIILLSFSLILLRVLLLGYYSNMLRLRLYRENLNLAEDIAERTRVQDELESYRNRLEEMVAKRTSELEKARDAAETANIAKSAFLANMSHEIRTPLNAITGMAHLIRRQGLTPHQDDQMQKLDQASRHLIDIINAILDLSKIEAGKFDLAKEEIHLDKLAANIRAIMHDRLMAKRLDFNVDLPDRPLLLQGDPTRLQQALINYIGNAIKFTDTGHIDLRIRVEEETDDDVLLRYEVEDTGIGIGPEELPRLFAPFEQVDNTSTRKYGGTGLGLAITREIARLMAGDAGVTSTLGQGSTFWFTTRLKKLGGHPVDTTPRSTAPDAEATLAEHHAGRRILITEDDPINAEIAKLLLTEARLEVDLAMNGAEAIEKAAHAPYDLILMDLQMPVMNGVEAALRIRADAMNAGTPIIAMTANAFDEVRQNVLAAGMNDFLAKPVDPDQLYATLLKWFTPTNSG